MEQLGAPILPSLLPLPFHWATNAASGGSAKDAFVGPLPRSLAAFFHDDDGTGNAAISLVRAHELCAARVGCELDHSFPLSIFFVACNAT